jgi:hypothetical protein
MTDECLDEYVASRIKAGSDGHIIWTGSMSAKTPTVNFVKAGQRCRISVRRLLFLPKHQWGDRTVLIRCTCNEDRCVNLNHMEFVRSAKGETVQPRTFVKALNLGGLFASKLSADQERRALDMWKVGRTQTDIASQMGVSQSTISRVVRRGRNEA